MADQLAALVISGRKRATASLMRDYATGGEPLPRVGDLVVVVDGRGTPEVHLAHHRGRREALDRG